MPVSHVSGSQSSQVLVLFDLERTLIDPESWEVEGVRVCFDPLKYHIFHSKLLLDNSASFTSSRMKDLCR